MDKTQKVCHGDGNRDTNTGLSVNSDGLTEEQFLAEYDDSIFKKPSVTADSILFSKKDGKLALLMIQRGNFPCMGQWAFPGGFMNDGETCEMTAKRELEEETGIKDLFLEQLYTISTPNRDRRGWIITCCCIGFADKPMLAVGADDASDAKWFTVECRENGEFTQVVLKSDDIVISADLNVVRTQSGKIDVAKTSVAYSDGIAFDHAKIILYALESL